MKPQFPADEILLSSDKTVAIIDGSGVLADPVGINREELIRLAKLRVPVSHFDKSKLNKEGYLVNIEDQDVQLPCKLLHAGLVALSC
jgi:glutamate dehydrogenase